MAFLTISRNIEIDYKKEMNSDHPETPESGPVSDPVPIPPVEPGSAVRSLPAEQVVLMTRLVGQPGEPLWLKAPLPPIQRKPRTRLPLLLLFLTCISTFLVGANRQMPVMPHDIAELFKMNSTALHGWLWRGFTYSSAVILILGAHELGHYLQARRYGVPASFPFFIPLPISPFGTMGAVIVQQSGVADRKSMFDIAISGPLAGLVVALPVVYWGIVKAQVLALPMYTRVAVFGGPLLLKWMMRMVHGPLPEGSNIIINPLLFAGWVGIFITGLNLVPIGQLDGGHILYCLIGRRAHVVARGLFWLAAGTVIYSTLFGDGSYASWWLMLFLIWIFGTRHPPTANDRVPLGPFRVVLGWLTLLFVFIGLTPTPMYEIQMKPKPRTPIHHQLNEKNRT